MYTINWHCNGWITHFRSIVKIGLFFHGVHERRGSYNISVDYIYNWQDKRKTLHRVHYSSPPPPPYSKSASWLHTIILILIVRTYAMQMHVDLCWFIMPWSSLMWPKDYSNMCHIFYLKIYVNFLQSAWIRPQNLPNQDSWGDITCQSPSSKHYYFNRYFYVR